MTEQSDDTGIPNFFFLSSIEMRVEKEGVGHFLNPFLVLAFIYKGLYCSL